MKADVPLESLVEVRARVSRFHREAVEDELLGWTSVVTLEQRES